MSISKETKKAAEKNQSPYFVSIVKLYIASLISMTIVLRYLTSLPETAIA